MEIRLLRYFIVVAEELSFSRAAERLNMAQPPLSQAIQALESRLKVQLFDRGKRPLQLTSAGRSLLEDARSILENVEETIRKVRRIDRGEAGALTLGFTSSMANSVLPDILHTFRERYPSIELILLEENTAFQMQRLRDRQTDVAFVYKFQALPEADDLGIMAIEGQSLVVVLPETHSLASQAKICVSDLAEEPFVMPLQSIVAGLSQQIDLLCSRSGFIPKIAQEAIYMVTILGLVAGGIGISILPSSVRSLQRQSVVYRPLQGQVPEIELAAVWRPDNASVTLHHFVELLREKYQLD